MPDASGSQTPPPPQEKKLPVAAAVFALIGLLAGAGVWMLASELAIGWRLLLAVVVAGPFVLLGDLLRDKTKAPPGVKPLPPDEEDWGVPRRKP
ncbi:MAG: hypothetical protein IT515_05820 [Burkholderiales bacterium]|nr:hypothetical protein [Burkholderiales bacterium]